MEDHRQTRATSALPSAGRTALGLLALVACLTAVRSYAHVRLVDLDSFDESAALQAGLNFFNSGPPNAEDSPLYAFWYWLGAHLAPAPLALYEGNWVVLVFVTLLLMALALHRVGVSSRWTAVSVTVLSALACFDLKTRASLFYGCFALTAAVLLTGAPSMAAGLRRASVILAIAAFVRPEALLACALTVTASIVIDKNWARALIAPAVAFTALDLLLGVPFGKGRAMAAFGQHYALNVVESDGSPSDPWIGYERYLRADFGSATNLLSALKNNPRAVAWHIAANLRRIPVTGYVVTPSGSVSRTIQAILGIPFAALFVAGLTFAGRRIRTDDHVQRLALFAVTLLIPWILSALLIWPRPHYFVAPFLCLFALATYGWKYWYGEIPFTWSLSLVMLVITSVLLNGASASSSMTPRRSTVRALRRLAMPAGVKILESDYGLALYLGGYNDARQNITEDVSRCRPFRDCVAADRVDVIVANERLRRLYFADVGYSSFIAAPAALGFTEVPGDPSSMRIFVRRKAL